MRNTLHGGGQHRVYHADHRQEAIGYQQAYIISHLLVAEPTDHSVPRSNGASDIIIVGPQGETK
jgi:hypothetical protein